MFVRYLILMTMVLFSQQLTAAEVIEHLQGNTFDSATAENAKLEVRILRWAETEEHEQVLTAYNDYLESQNGTPLLTALRGFRIKGYLLTNESTGYMIYHAWREEIENGERQVLLVTPGLKTKHPLMWKQANQDNTRFTLVELRKNNEAWQVKTSLDNDILVDDQNRLRLSDFDAANEFGMLHEAM